MDITIHFSTGKTNGFMTKAIRWWTKSKISHTVVTYYNPTFDTYMVLTANNEGFMDIPWDRWSAQNNILYTFIPQKPTEEGLKFIGRKYLGTKYDYGSFWANALRLRFGFLWRLLRKWKWLSKKLLDPAEVMCSESIIRLLQKEKFKFVKGVDPELTDQEELLQLFLKAPKDEIKRLNPPK